MDNLGDWIYIIFLIVAAISGLYNSKSKKKRPTQVLGQPGHDKAPEEETASDKGFWEILEETINEGPRKPDAPPVPPVKKNNPQKQPVHTPFLTSEQAIHSPKVSVPQKTHFLTEEEHTACEDIRLNTPETLKKAVIYSEILNRKY